MKISPALAAAAGFAGMLAVYFGVLSLLNSPQHALSQFKSDYWWVLLLAFGMAIQLWIHAKISSGVAAVGASGGASGTAMLACCAHHVADFAPLAGAAFLAPFFERYQLVFIGLGVLLNIAGISSAMEHARMAGAGVPFARYFSNGMWKWEVAIGMGLLMGVAFGIYAGLNRGGFNG